MSEQWGPAVGRSAAGASTLMTKITGARTTTWDLLAALSDRPDAALVQRVCDEPLLDTLRDSVRWLDEDWRPNGLLVLEVLPRRAKRRGIEATLGTMLDAHLAAGSLVRRLHAACAEIHVLCTKELSAWRAVDEARAKELRVEQMTLLTPDSTVRDQARALQRVRLPVYSPVADLVTAYLELETGR